MVIFFFKFDVNFNVLIQTVQLQDSGFPKEQFHKVPHQKLKCGESLADQQERKSNSAQRGFTIVCHKDLY